MKTNHFARALSLSILALAGFAITGCDAPDTADLDAPSSSGGDEGGGDQGGDQGGDEGGGDRGGDQGGGGAGESRRGVGGDDLLPAGASIEGSWISPSCGARTYPRLITFDDGQFQATDLISPCPYGLVCIWSGIVKTLGTYAVSGDTIELTVLDGWSGKGQPLPASMTIDPATEAPAEVADGELCPYTPAKPYTDKKP